MVRTPLTPARPINRSAGQLKAPPGLGSMIALKLVLAVLALRPFMITAHFSAGTNDSQPSRFRGWVMVGFAVPCAFVILGLGVGSVLVPYWWSWLLLTAFALVNWGLYAVHRRCYDRMVFDLQPSTSLGQHPTG